MPFITLPKEEQFTAVDVEGDFKDDNFSYLIGFEEFVPEGCSEEKKKNQKKNNQQKKKGASEGTKKALNAEEEKKDNADQAVNAEDGKKDGADHAVNAEDGKKDGADQAVNAEDGKKDGADKPKSKNQRRNEAKKAKRKAMKEKGESVVTDNQKSEEKSEENLEEKSGEETKKPSGLITKSKQEEERLLKRRERKRQNRKNKRKGAENSEAEEVPNKKKKEAAAKADQKSSAEEEDAAESEKPNDPVEEEEDTGDYSAWDRFFLPPEIMKALKKEKFYKPSDIQESTLVNTVQNRLDVLGAAETGSGKTLAFVIPVINRLLSMEQSEGPKALIIAPTRELAVQIKKVTTAMCAFSKLQVACIVGGLAEIKQLRVMSKRKPEIVVATPGRLWDLMKNEKCEYLTHLEDIQCVVVDETDRMVEQGHFNELKSILQLVKSKSTAALNDKMQMLVFSATLTYVLPANKTKTFTTEQKIEYLIDELGLRSQRAVIDVTNNSATPKRLVETRLNCDDLLDKDLNVVYLLNRYKGRTLIFTNSVDASRRLYGILGHLKMNPHILNSNMIQRQRLKNLERFTASKEAVLLATDVAARGLDIKGIEHVIHYQVPKTVETYIHRSGRTARASQSGLAVLMVDPKDANLYRRLCKNLQREKDLPVFPIDSPHLKSALRERVRLASEMDVTLYRAKKIRLNENWFQKAARDADLLLEDRHGEIENANQSLSALLSVQDDVKYRLSQELRTPLPGINYLKENLKTSYVTPELAALHSQSVSYEALEGLNAKMTEIKDLKKKMRRKAKMVTKPKAKV